MNFQEFDIPHFVQTCDFKHFILIDFRSQKRV
jgi:hypothetical protein